jgi:diguanylate cyclase (GGDEF)-like protein
MSLWKAEFAVPLLALGLGLTFFLILRLVTRGLHEQITEIQHRAYHDDLTELPNRTLFNDRAELAMEEGTANGTRLAVMLVDLDGFKDVNDTLGHDCGDRLLRGIAADLPRYMREGDTVARLGGDEFGILANGISDPTAVLALAQKVRAVLAQPRAVDGIELTVDASIGIALSPDHGNDVETLMRCADVAMYRSKETHAPALYEPEQDRYSPERLALITDLSRAIANSELLVDYQPQCDPVSGELHGVEALVRWHHPDRGLLMPDEFIPLAEHTGLIRQLTRHVLDAALQQCRKWELSGRSLTVAVNISSRDLLDERFPEEVKSQLTRWKVDPRLLELEMSERSALTDLPRARAHLAELSHLGVSLAIDDFGAGTSSLAHIRRLPVDALKVDRSLVMRIPGSEPDAAIVRSTILLAHALGLRVTATGVETADCNRALAGLGCDAVQGFHFGRAMRPEAIEHWSVT